MKLLIVEDEKHITESIKNHFCGEDFQRDMARDYDIALEKIHLNEFVCIILDISLPHGKGLDLLKVLKKKSQTDGVVIISAKNSVQERRMLKRIIQF